MDSEEKLSKTVEAYQEAAKANPNIDVGMLMANALANQRKYSVDPRTKKWLYLLSVALPPLGLGFAAKYYFFDTSDDAKEIASICTVLTIFSLIILWFTGKFIFSGSGASVQQIEQIKPSDIQQILQ